MPKRNVENKRRVGAQQSPQVMCRGDEEVNRSRPKASWSDSEVSMSPCPDPDTHTQEEPRRVATSPPRRPAPAHTGRPATERPAALWWRLARRRFRGAQPASRCLGHRQGGPVGVLPARRAPGTAQGPLRGTIAHDGTTKLGYGRSLCCCCIAAVSNTIALAVHSVHPPGRQSTSLHIARSTKSRSTNQTCNAPCASTSSPRKQ